MGGKDMYTVDQGVSLTLEDDLVNLVNVEPVLEIPGRSIGPICAEFGLDREPGAVVDGNQEVDFTTVAVPEITKFDPIPFAVFNEMAELEKVNGDKVLESGALIRDLTPVPEVELRHPFQTPNPPGRPGKNPEGVIQPVKDVYPVTDRTVAGVEILPQGVDGQRRTHSLGQEVGQNLNPGNRSDFFEVSYVFEEYAVDSLLLPAAKGSGRLGEKGFGKSPKLHQGPNGGTRDVGRKIKLTVEITGGKVMPRPLDLGESKGMQTVMVITPLKRVSTGPVQVEPGAPGDEKSDAIMMNVEFPLDPTLPSVPFVQFVQYYEGGGRGPRGVPNFSSVVPVVPVEVTPMIRSLQEALGHRGLADLARPGNKHHFGCEIFRDRQFEIPSFDHEQIMPQRKKCCDIFLV